MKRHDTDPLSLVAGLLFVALGSVFLLDEIEVWTVDVAWVPAVALVALGLAGLLVTLTCGRRVPEQEPEP